MSPGRHKSSSCLPVPSPHPHPQSPPCTPNEFVSQLFASDRTLPRHAGPFLTREEQRGRELSDAPVPFYNTVSSAHSFNTKHNGDYGKQDYTPPLTERILRNAGYTTTSPPLPTTPMTATGVVAGVVAGIHTRASTAPVRASRKNSKLKFTATSNSEHFPAMKNAWHDPGTERVRTCMFIYDEFINNVCYFMKCSVRRCRRALGRSC